MIEIDRTPHSPSHLKPSFRDYGTDRESALYCPVGGNVNVAGAAATGGVASSTKAGVGGKDDKALADYYQRCVE